MCSSTLLWANVPPPSIESGNPAVTDKGLVIESSLACWTQSSRLAIRPSATPSDAVDARRLTCPSRPSGASKRRFCRKRPRRHKQTRKGYE